MSRRRAKNSAPVAAEELVDVHCGCGWGRLHCPLSEAPAACPLCGDVFDREIFVENPQEVETSGRCGHCGSDPCRDLENCDLWWGTNIGPKALAEARARAEIASRPRPAAEPPGPDYEAMILDEQDERYEMNRRNPRASEISSTGAALPDRGFLKTRGRGTFRVEPLDGYRAVKVTPWERGLPQSEIRATHIDVTDERDLAGNPRQIARPRGKPRRDWWKRRNAGHECPADGKDQRGRCVGLCGQCGEHGLTTGRYTSYCPSCQTCEACGCPEADGFSHYEGCRFAVGDVAHLAGEERGAHLDMPLPRAPHTRMTPNPRHDKFCPCVKCEIKKRHKAGCSCGKGKCEKNKHWSAQSGHYPGQTRCPKCEGPCKANPTPMGPPLTLEQAKNRAVLNAFASQEARIVIQDDFRPGSYVVRPLASFPWADVKSWNVRLPGGLTSPVYVIAWEDGTVDMAPVEQLGPRLRELGPLPPPPTPMIPNGRRRPDKTRRNDKSTGRKAVIVEVDIGLDSSIDDVLAEPNVTDDQIDAALAGFDPSRTFAVRSDVEEILRRAGIKAVAHSSQVDGTMVLAYAIPVTHNPVVVAAALKKFFRGQKDVRVSLSK